MRLDLDVTTLTANVAERTIEGLVAPYGQVGRTSLGPTTIVAGSIELPADVSRVKLLREHDRTDPVAVAESFADTDDGLRGTFRVPPGEAGDRALAEAASIRDGLSVGLRVAESERSESGEVRVTAASLVEVSQVAIAAFPAAQVEAIASEPEEGPKVETDTEPTEGPTEGPEFATAAAVTELADHVSDQLRELQAGAYASEPAPDLGPTIDDVHRDMLASIADRRPFHYEADPAHVKAALGITNTGTSAMQQKYWSGLVHAPDAGRVMITNGAVKRPIGPDGLSMNLPVLNADATAAKQTAENAEVESTAVEVGWQTTTIDTYNSGNRLSLQAAERSNPSSLQIIQDRQRMAVAHATEDAYLAAVKAGIPAGNKTATGSTFAADIASLAGSLQAGGYNLSDVFLGTLGFKRAISAIFNSSGPAFWAGSTDPGATAAGFVGRMGSINLWTSSRLGSADFIGLDRTVSSWWQGAGPLGVRITFPATLSVEISHYLYGAPSIELPNGLAEITGQTADPASVGKK